ncbi:MAG: TniQ family protein [Micropepsaceae bacterium]
MIGLALGLAPLPQEPAISVASRIALKLGIPSVSDCLLDLGVNWALFRRGQPTAIAQFAEVIGADASPLLHESFMPQPEGRFGFRGHILDRPMVNRREVRLCPRCVMEDHERHGALRRYGRSPWQLTHFRTCPHHYVPIISLPRPPAPHYALDFARIIERNFDVVQRTAALPETRQHHFESWLIDRLADQTSDRWFDRLGVSVIAQFCEKAGTALCFGPQAAPLRLDEAQLAVATEAAFQRLAGTEGGFTPLFEEIWKACPSRRPCYYTALGNLWRWLDKIKADQRYAQLLRDAADFVFSHQAIPPGTTLLGQTCKERRYHSISSAAIAHGLNVSRTDRLLRSLTRDGRELDAETLDPLLARISSSIPRVQAAKRLGVSPDVFDLFRRIGRINAAFSGDNVADLYDVEELDRLRHAVFVHARIVRERPANCSRITAAVGLVAVTSEKILLMIAEGKLAFVGQEPGNQKMCDLYVNREELRDLVHGPEQPIPNDQLTIEQARSVLYLNTETIAWFMRGGYLQTTRHWSARRRCHYRLIAKAEIEAFADQYVSLGALAAEARIQANHVARRLERRGIFPLGFPARLNKIFLRQAVQPPEHVGRLPG